MAAKKKANRTLLIVLVLAAAGGGGYWYYQNKKKKQQAGSALNSSNQAQGLAPLPLNMPSPMEYPNQMSGTPTIQNFVSQPAPVTSSTQTTIIQPILTGFHHKPNFHRPHPPTSPHREGHSHGH